MLGSSIWKTLHQEDPPCCHLTNIMSSPGLKLMFSEQELIAPTRGLANQLVVLASPGFSTGVCHVSHSSCWYCGVLVLHGTASGAKILMCELANIALPLTSLARVRHLPCCTSRATFLLLSTMTNLISYMTRSRRGHQYEYRTIPNGDPPMLLLHSYYV
jgi:hypothetical protein